MVNVNKKLEDVKEDLDEKGIKSSLHRIERRLGKIEDEIAEGRIFTSLCVFSSFCIAAGFALVGISLRHDTIATFSGVFLLMGGGVILSGGFINNNKKHTLSKIWFSSGFLSIIIGILLLLYACF